MVVTASNFPANSKLATLVDGVDVDGRGVNSDSKGYFSEKFIPLKPLTVGTHTLTVRDLAGKNSASATFVITAGNTSQVTLSQSTVSAADLFFNGIQVTGSGFPANKPVTIGLYATDKILGTSLANSQGQLSYRLKADLNPGTHRLAFNDDSDYAATSLTVTPSLSLSLSSQKISSENLASQGVVLQANFLSIGTTVEVLLDNTYLGSYNLDASRNLLLNIKRSGIPAGQHSINLRWPEWVNNGEVVPFSPYGTASLPSEVTNTVPAVAAVPASNTEELANTGSNLVPGLLGLAMIAAGAAAILLTRRQPAAG